MRRAEKEDVWDGRGEENSVPGRKLFYRQWKILGSDLCCYLLSIVYLRV